jgi:hypothetical protein
MTEGKPVFDTPGVFARGHVLRWPPAGLRGANSQS